MIDEYTRDRFEAVVKRALHDGVPLIDALADARLLQTEPEIKQQWAQCLEQLAYNIDSQQVGDLVQMGGGQNTPLDAVRGVLNYIDIFKNIFAAQAGETR